MYFQSTSCVQETQSLIAFFSRSSLAAYTVKKQLFKIARRLQETSSIESFLVKLRD